MPMLGLACTAMKRQGRRGHVSVEDIVAILLCPSREIDSFLQGVLTVTYCLATGTKAMETTDPGLKALKPGAKNIFFPVY